MDRPPPRLDTTGEELRTSTTHAILNDSTRLKPKGCPVVDVNGCKGKSKAVPLI